MTFSGDEPLFLTVEDVTELHAQQLDRFGGSAGIRDPGALASALGTPASSYDGQFLHDDLFTWRLPTRFTSRRTSPSSTETSELLSTLPSSSWTSTVGPFRTPEID